MSEFQLDRLDNGLRVVTVEMPHLHSAELVAYVGLGGRHEEPALSGIAHFLEHTIFRGTAAYPTSVALERAFEAIGGSVNATTDMETTSYFTRLHPDHLEQGMELFAEMLRRPLLQGVELERRIIREEAREDLNEKGEEINPDNIAARLLWPDHPLGRPLIGTDATLERIDVAALRRYHRQFHAPPNVVLAATGRVQHAAVLAAARAAFGDWQGNSAPEFLPAPAATAGPECCWVKDPGSQVSVQLCFVAPGQADPTSMALRLLRRVLAWGGGSRLMLRLREELGLVYAAEAELLQYADTGALAIDFAVAPEALVPAVEECLRLLTQLCRGPIPTEELTGVRRGYLYDLDFSRDQPGEMAVRYGWGTLVELRRSLAEDRQEAEALTAADLLQVARQVLTPAGLKLVAVGPWRRGDRKQVEKLVLDWGRD